MSETSSSSSSSGRVTKLTAAGKVPAWHFMDIPTEEREPGKRATALRAIAALAMLAVVVLILAAIAVKLYHQEEEVLPEVKNYVGQRMVDAKGFVSEFKDYIMSFFTANKKYMLEITPEGSNSFMDLKWKKIKKFNVNIK